MNIGFNSFISLFDWHLSQTAMNYNKVALIIHRFLESTKKMFRRKRSAQEWGCLLLLSVMGLSDLPATNLIEGTLAVRWTIVTLIAVFKATLITYTLYLSRKRKALFVSFTIMAAIYAFLCLVNFISYKLYGFGITTKLMTIISQTNKRELMEFMPILGADVLHVLGLPAFWAGILSGAGILYIIPRLMRRKSAIAVLLASNVAGLGCLCFCAVSFHAGKKLLFMTLRTSANIYRCIDDRKALKELENCRRPFPYSDKVRTEERASNVILVIGESASRDHHSIYGYPLPTTPCLDSIRRKLFIFKDAIGSGTATAHNIECILSFKSDNDTALTWHDTPWLIDLYNHAGYKTFWLSNQEKTGMWSNVSAVMVSGADVIEYVGAESGSDYTLGKYDSFLWKPFDKAMTDTAGKKLICLHLLGSHFVYSKRYPPEYEAFRKDDVKALAANKWMDDKTAAVVAEYDNSIRYTDTVLRHLIVSASRNKEATILVYLSDHGEVVYDGRDFKGRDRTSVRVPFIIYANEAYMTRNPDIIKRLKEAEHTKFSTSDAIHLLMSLTGISYPYYDPTKDIISETFLPHTRYIDDQVWEYDTY